MNPFSPHTDLSLPGQFRHTAPELDITIEQVSIQMFFGSEVAILCAAL